MSARVHTNGRDRRGRSSLKKKKAHPYAALPAYLRALIAEWHAARRRGRELTRKLRCR